MVPSDSQRSRVRLSVAAAVLLCAAMLAVAPWRSAGAQAETRTHMDMSGAVTARQLAFRNSMRVLWEQHVAWTRLAIVSFNGSLPDLAATEARLLRNQVDIGNAVKPFYGRAAGNRLTGLLRRHILIAVDILADVKGGHQHALNGDLERWYANANQISAFLHKANPHNWPLPALRGAHVLGLAGRVLVDGDALR
jgi:hypothetical protein